MINPNHKNSKEAEVHIQLLLNQILFLSTSDINKTIQATYFSTCMPYNFTGQPMHYKVLGLALQKILITL
jgi:hypothetical protein